MRNLLTLFLMLLGTTHCFSLEIANDTKEKIHIVIQAEREPVEYHEGESATVFPMIKFNAFNLEPGEKWENTQAYTDFGRDAKKLYDTQPFIITVWGSEIVPKRHSPHIACHVQSEIDHVSFVPGKKKGWLECKNSLQKHVPSTIGKKPQ